MSNLYQCRTGHLVGDEMTLYSNSVQTDVGLLKLDSLVKVGLQKDISSVNREVARHRPHPSPHTNTPKIQEHFFFLTNLKNI